MVSRNRILVVDDSPTQVEQLRALLEREGYAVEVALSGREGLERARTVPPDLIVSDIVMPEMDGIELARKATELDPDLKVMFITGFAAVALNADSTAPKQAKVLSKPIHLRDLVNEVEKLLAA